MKISTMSYEEIFYFLIFNKIKMKRFFECLKVLDTVEGYEDLLEEALQLLVKQ